MRGMTHMPTGWPSAADPYGFGAPRPPVEPLFPQDRPPTVTRDDALAACARVRDLLGEPQWDGHDALEFVVSIEETLR